MGSYERVGVFPNRDLGKRPSGLKILPDMDTSDRLDPVTGMNSGGWDGIIFGWHRLALPAISSTSGVFSFLRATFFRPFRLSLVPTICPWVSEDGRGLKLLVYVRIVVATI